MDAKITNNTVILIGEIVSGFTYSHEIFGEGFYMVDLAVKRLSEQVDVIPLTISERLINMNDISLGDMVEVRGQFRSRNQFGEDKKRLILSVFVREVIFLEEEITDYTKTNFISLDGFICKPPIYRKTPLGREIADLLLAVNRPYGKSDYIPCIVWGRNARYASGLLVGNRLEIYGRIQSREYEKKISEIEVSKRTAYEVSVSKLEVPEHD
ncbi:single-stranded DNA-binding protein [Lacrimispora sp.]|uniref:single-stranded DNA-binding protein n=1 Tax=Lacrimispora sp. TaxID=2719234 RepID=UPI003994FA4B